MTEVIETKISLNLEMMFSLATFVTLYNDSQA